MAAYRDEVEALRARAEAAEGELRRLRGEAPAGRAPEAIALHLAPGERVLWEGRPLPWRFALRRFRAFSPVGIAVALWLAVVALEAVRGIASAAALLPFAACAAWVGSAIAWRLREALSTRYLLTDRDALVVTLGRRTLVRRFRRADLGEVVVNRRADGSGDVVLRREAPAHGRGPETHVGFLAVPDVRAVEAILLARPGSEA